MTHRQTRTLAGGTPLKKATGTEVRMDVVIDYTTVTVDSNSQRIVTPGELLCRITASDKFGPYLSTASNGQQTVAARDSGVIQTVIAAQRANVTLGDGALGAFYHNCVFDKSIIEAESEATTNIGEDDLEAAFPTCIFDD